MPELDQIEGQYVYQPDGKVLARFVADRSEVAVIVGPIGSGTSSAACMRIWQTACEQAPSPRDGLRHSRWAIVRSTYPELRTAVVETWLFWFPEQAYGGIAWSRPMHQVMRVGDVELDVWFLALDGEDDLKKLRSVEYTGIFFNEIEFQDHVVFIEGKSRTGRYPHMADGGASWSGVIADMNAPPEEHFIARMAGWSDWPDETPADKRLKWPPEWTIFRQPPGLIEVMGPDGKTIADYVENPEAENLKWLPHGYYREKARGALKSWIDARIMNRVTYLAAGDPVWPGFRPELHIAPRSLTFVPDRELIISLDFGRRPAALVGQEVGDKLHLLAEFRLYGVGAVIFAPALKRFLEQRFRGGKIRCTGDPKGADKSQSSERSAYDIFASYGMTVTPATGRGRINDINERLEAVAYAFQTNRILISPECTTLRGACAGKYTWRRLDQGDAEPVKDKWSDIADCLQYLCLFIGEGRRMIGLTPGQAWTGKKVAQARSLRRVSG